MAQIAHYNVRIRRTGRIWKLSRAFERRHNQGISENVLWKGKETYMLKIFKYLKESKWSVLAIIALLVVQAYCDLALPQ